MNYEQNALALDRELCNLLGYTDSGYKDEWGDVQWQIPNQQAWRVFRWTLDDAAAFQLMVEHQVCLVLYDFAVTADLHKATHYKDFLDNQSAVRFAIVQAVVNKLKGNV